MAQRRYWLAAALTAVGGLLAPFWIMDPSGGIGMAIGAIATVTGAYILPPVSCVEDAAVRRLE